MFFSSFRCMITMSVVKPFMLLLLAWTLLLLHVATPAVAAPVTMSAVMAQKEANVLALVNATERVFAARCTENNLCVVNTTRCSASTCGGSPALQQSLTCEFGLGTDTSMCGAQCAGLMRSTTTSAVSIASGATNNQESSTFVCSTASLTSVFADLFYNQGVTGWQYVASNTGVTRQFPAAASTSSCSTTPDTRQQSWYVSASTGPKDIVFVCDFSGSMNTGDGGPGGMTRADAMRVAVVALLGSLGPNDRFNIVAFSSSPTVVGTAGQLMAGTPANIQSMQRQFNAWPVGGGTVFGPAMDLAFSLFTANPATTTGCARLVMFLTDGQPSDGSTVFTSIASGQATLGRNPARVFTYSLSAAATHSTLQSIACTNNGIWSKITDASSPTSPLQQYYNFLAAGIVDGRPQWTAPYASTFGQGQIVTVSQPIFDKSQTPKVFVGVAAIDVLVSELLQYGTLTQLTSLIAAKSGYCLSYDLTACQMQKLREGSTFVCPSPAPTIASCGTTYVTVPSCNTTIVTNINEVICGGSTTTSNTAANTANMTCCKAKECATKSSRLTPSRSIPPTITIRESFSKTLMDDPTSSKSASDEGTKTITINRFTPSTSSSISEPQSVTLSPSEESTTTPTLRLTVTKSLAPTLTAIMSLTVTKTMTSSVEVTKTDSFTQTLLQTHSHSIALTDTERGTETDRLTPSKRLSHSHTTLLTETVVDTATRRSPTLSSSRSKTRTSLITISPRLTLTRSKPHGTRSVPMTMSKSWACVNQTALAQAFEAFFLQNVYTLTINNDAIVSGFNTSLALPTEPLNRLGLPASLTNPSLHIPFFSEAFNVTLFVVKRPTTPENDDGFKKMPGLTAQLQLLFPFGLWGPDRGTNGNATAGGGGGGGSLPVVLRCPPHPEFSIYAGEAVELWMPLPALTMGSLCQGGGGTISTGSSTGIMVMVLFINTPNSIFLAAGQSLVTATIVTASVAAVPFGGAAPDLQVIIMTAMIPCASAFQRRSFELYRAISPFTISDSFEGVLWGNLIANVAAIIVHGVLVLVISLVKRLPLSEAAPIAWFPNLSLQLMVMTYPGTAFAVGQVFISTGTSDLEALLLAIAMLVIFVIGYPAGVMWYVKTYVSATFDLFEYHRWRRDQSGLHVRLLSRALLPVGSWDPPDLRRRYGTLITLQCRPERAWMTFPVWSPLIVAVAGLFNIKSQTFCLALYSVMILLHMIIVLIIWKFRPFRSLIEDWFAAFGIILTTIFLVFAITNSVQSASVAVQNLLWITSLAQLGLLVVRLLYHISHIFIARKLRGSVPHVELFRWNEGGIVEKNEVGEMDVLDALLKQTENAGFLGDEELMMLAGLDAGDGDGAGDGDELDEEVRGAARAAELRAQMALLGGGESSSGVTDTTTRDRTQSSYVTDLYGGGAGGGLSTLL